LQDQQHIDLHYNRYYREVIAREVPTEQDALKLLIENDLWSLAQDEEIKRLKDERDNLKITATQVVLPSQKMKVLSSVDKINKNIHQKEVARLELIGITAENYSTNRAHEHILQTCVYKDQELTKTYYSEGEFDELEHSELIKVIQLRHELIKRLDDDHLQKAALLPFFSLYLPLCEDVNGFFGKPVTNLTIPQLKLCSFGRVFFSIFQYVDDIPDNIREDPAKLLSFSDAQRNKGKKKGVNLKEDADASMVFGATKEDMKAVAGREGVSLGDALKKKGGTLNMEDMMKLSGV
jgi:hypothetical protein